MTESPSTLPAAPISAENFHVVIRNRQKVMFDGQVSSLTSVNTKGKFDVLPQHANFISLIERYIILRRPNQPDETIKIPGGVMHVKEAETRIYLD